LTTTGIRLNSILLILKKIKRQIMLDLKFIRENTELVKKNNENKKASAFVDGVISLDEKRREIISEVEQLKNQRNVNSKEIGKLKKEKKDASHIISAMKEVSDKIAELDIELRKVEEQLQSEILRIPNLTDDSVPVGLSEDDNLEIRVKGEKQAKKHDLDHIEIGNKLGLFDFDRGAKVTGSGFAFMTGLGAKLERSLINYFLDQNTDRGYQEMMTPFIVNQNSMTGTGQLPKMAEDMYHAAEDNLYLIPTAEVPLTNFYNGEMLNPKDLTTKFTGYSPCFRREAGSHGKDVRGFLRVHQFNKVELVKFAKPEDSDKELESLVADVENLLEGLGLTYRVILLCTGDTSFASAKTYDLEVWSPKEEKWLEVSSCSNFKDFQARRANIRFKRSADEKPEFVHTLNGSGLATPRILVALIENYFDGEKLVIPSVLRKYMGIDEIKTQ
jgi:seryl-tRNA synthetase